MVYVECIMHFTFECSYFVEYVANCAVCDIYLRWLLCKSVHSLQRFSNETRIPFWTWRIQHQSIIEWNACTISQINHHLCLMSKLNPTKVYLIELQAIHIFN